MKKTIVAMLIPLALAACASAPKTASTGAAGSSNAAASGAQTQAMSMSSENEKLLAKLKQESVYFDFDKSAVKNEYSGAVKDHADFMKSNPNDEVTLEGNCDERGSDEYNLALGNRRATAVARQLEILGVSKNRVKTVSNGEEKPRLTCHAERCWKENRRVDFMHHI